MSGHTNRNRRNGGNARSRHGPPRQRGSDGRAVQPKNTGHASDKAKSQHPDTNVDTNVEQTAAQPSFGPADVSSPSTGEAPESPSEPVVPVVNEDAAPPEVARPPEHATRPEVDAGDGQNTPHRGRPPFIAPTRGGQAYIPANGARMSVNSPNSQNGRVGKQSSNGQNGQNGIGHSNGHRSANGHMPIKRVEPAPPTSDADEFEGDASAVPALWRVERLNGGVDSTPREPFRPESRGEVGPLIDALHEIFAQDRSQASRSDSARCGICYLHFQVAELEYREAEGFYVCVGCRRALGHQQVMMIRRQQMQHGS
jgi:hypothetical protein